MRGLPAAVAALLLLTPTLPLKAGDFSSSARGTAVADFLNIGVSARALALGGAYTAAVDDATAPYWNPAAMTRVRRRSLALMYESYVDSSYFDYVGYVQNEGRIGAFGAAVQYFSAGRIRQTDINGAELGAFFPYDMALHWSYAYLFQDSSFAPALEGYAFGVTAKLVDSRIVNSASAGAIDLGVLSPLFFGGRTRFAFSALNLGGDTMQFAQTPETLPTTLRFGVCHRPSSVWMATFDLGLPQNDRPYAAAGIEHSLLTRSEWEFAARAGFNTQTIGSIDGITGFSLGFGIGAKGRGVDYAFAPYGGLGQAHRLSLTYSF